MPHPYGCPLRVTLNTTAETPVPKPGYLKGYPYIRNPWHVWYIYFIEDFWIEVERTLEGDAS